MKILDSFDDFAELPMMVVLHCEGRKARTTACGWSKGCPQRGVDEVECYDCPANKVDTQLTYSEAKEWWESK